MDEGRARTLLRAERAEVTALLKQTQEAEKIDLQAPDSGEDYSDAAQPLTEQANDAAVADQLQSRLDAIDRALARIEAGSYGRSVLSGKPIPGERLEADPAAELTVEEARAQRLPAAAGIPWPEGLQPGTSAYITQIYGTNNRVIFPRLAARNPN